jgi:hypothetical protein
LVVEEGAEGGGDDQVVVDEGPSFAVVAGGVRPSFAGDAGAVGDYWRHYANETFFHFALEAVVFLWEAGDGRLTCVLNPGRPGEAWLQVDPTYDTPELEVDMINVAETQYALRQRNGTQKLAIWSPQTNRVRQRILEKRGYRHLPENEIEGQFFNHCFISQPSHWLYL